MSDWQVGDLALCVDDSACHCCNDPMPIRAGSVHRVSEVDSSWGYTGLAFEGVENESLHHYGFNQKSFRKIRPDEHRACEDEFVTLLKRSKVPETADGFDDFIRGGCPGVSGTVETRVGTVVRIVRRGAK